MPLIRARLVVQVHPGPPFKSVNTRRFSLFPFRGSLSKNHSAKRLSTSRLVSRIPMHPSAFRGKVTLVIGASDGTEKLREEEPMLILGDNKGLDTSKPLSILGLKGLGKEHWRGVDPSKHVERERASWD